MKIAIEKGSLSSVTADEGELFVDEDGDLNIVLAATHLNGIKEEDLVVCCLRSDAAWIRGAANHAELSRMTRLAPGDRITITIE